MSLLRSAATYAIQVFWTKFAQASHRHLDVSEPSGRVLRMILSVTPYIRGAAQSNENTIPSRYGHRTQFSTTALANCWLPLALLERRIDWHNLLSRPGADG